MMPEDQRYGRGPIGRRSRQSAPNPAVALIAPDQVDALARRKRCGSYVIVAALNRGLTMAQIEESPLGVLFDIATGRPGDFRTMRWD